MIPPRLPPLLLRMWWQMRAMTEFVAELPGGELEEWLCKERVEEFWDGIKLQCMVWEK